MTPTPLAEVLRLAHHVVRDYVEGNTVALADDVSALDAALERLDALTGDDEVLPR